MKFERLFFIASLCISVMLPGCNTSLSVNEMYADGTSSVLLKIASSPNSPFSRIAKRANIKISASDMNTIIRDLVITDSSVEGTITGIPAGVDRLFTVSVYDSLDTLQYTGNATANLPRGTTVSIPIDIIRVSANAVINGRVIESDSSLRSGLVAYYPLNGSAEDESGLMNNGAIHGTTLTSDRFGTANKAYQFNGIDNYIEVPYDSTLDCEKRISVAVWAKSDIMGDQYLEDGIILQMGSGGEAAYGMWVGKYVDVMQFVFCNHQSSAETTLVAINTATVNGAVRNTVLLDTLWHFYAFSFDGTIMKAYVDNKLIGTKNAVAGPITNGLPLRIGTESKSLARFWRGKIDAVRIYNRALSQEEIGVLSILND